MSVWGRAGEGEAERWRGEEGKDACSCSLRAVRTDCNVDLGKVKLTCLADARQFRGCAGLNLGTDVPREGLLTRAMDQSQSLCREYLKVKKVARLNGPFSSRLTILEGRVIRVVYYIFITSVHPQDELRGICTRIHAAGRH